MRVAVFSSKPYDEQYLGVAAAGSSHKLDFFEAQSGGDFSGGHHGYGSARFVGEAQHAFDQGLDELL